MLKPFDDGVYKSLRHHYRNDENGDRDFDTHPRSHLLTSEYTTSETTMAARVARISILNSD